MAQAHSDLADVLAANGRVADAIREYELAVLANPQLHEAHLSLGMALGRRGSLEKARVHLQKASESPNPEVRQAALSALGLTPR
jgi:Flp pilus assembly protein TadD